MPTARNLVQVYRSALVGDLYIATALMVLVMLQTAHVKQHSTRMQWEQQQQLTASSQQLLWKKQQKQPPLHQ